MTARAGSVIGKVGSGGGLDILRRVCSGVCIIDRLENTARIPLMYAYLYPEVNQTLCCNIFASL